MRPLCKSILWTTAAAAWLAAAAIGFSSLWGYESVAGAAAQAPATWPADSRLPRDARLPTLIVLIHPRCPCSRATIEELAKLMATCHEKLLATVLMIRPDGLPPGWERTDLWRSAAAIPGVAVQADPQGEEARRLGAATSGQTLLYANDGRLVFAGGITESRGHHGDNAGRSTIVSRVLRESDDAAQLTARTTPVYGCPLFNPNAKTCQINGKKICQN